MKTKTTHAGPGRPRYSPDIPRKRFTMNDLCEANGVSLKTGKGKNCSRLTLVKWVAAQLANKRSGLIQKAKGETQEPNSKDGLGRKAFVYMRRVGVTAKSTAKSPSKSPKVTTTADYEATKAAILAPVVAVTIGEPAPAPAPVAEVAPVAPTAPEVTATVPEMAVA